MGWDGEIYDSNVYIGVFLETRISCDSAVKMSLVHPEREFIHEQLTSAEETLAEFKTIIVKAEEEVDDQRRLLGLTQAPQIVLHRIGTKHLQY